MSSKTIITLLFNGNPNGLKSVHIPTEICKALVIPRTELDKIKIREEITRPSVYFLINSEDNQLYVGEGEFYDRIKNHDINKDWWNVAVQFFSQDKDFLTKSDIKYLEYLAYCEIKKINNITLENKQTPKYTHIPEHQKYSLEKFFEDIKFIIGFLGYNFFEKTEKKAENDIFYCKRNGVDAKGFYQDGKFTILDGSIISKNIKPSCKNFATRTLKRREELLGEHIEEVDSKFLKMKKDVQFQSPSAASCFVIGANSNGWLDWKNASGKTLDDVFNKNV